MRDPPRAAAFADDPEPTFEADHPSRRRRCCARAMPAAPHELGVHPNLQMKQRAAAPVPTGAPPAGAGRWRPISIVSRRCDGPDCRRLRHFARAVPAGRWRGTGRARAAGHAGAARPREGAGPRSRRAGRQRPPQQLQPGDAGDAGGGRRRHVHDAGRRRRPERDLFLPSALRRGAGALRRPPRLRPGAGRGAAARPRHGDLGTSSSTRRTRCRSCRSTSIATCRRCRRPAAAIASAGC